MSQNVATSAKNELLTSGAISDTKLQDLMGRMMSRKIDRGELFFQSNRNETWTLEEGLVKDGGLFGLTWDRRTSGHGREERFRLRGRYSSRGIGTDGKCSTIHCSPRYGRVSTSHSG